ncbi:serine protease snake-like [Sergentomyia squamirostris]
MFCRICLLSLLFCVVSTKSQQADRILFRDEKVEIGSPCKTPDGEGVCVLGTNCRDPFGGYYSNQGSSICFFKERTPIICCPRQMVLYDDSSAGGGIPPRPIFTPVSQPINTLVDETTREQLLPSRPPLNSPAGRISASKCKEYSQNYTNTPYVEKDSVVTISVVGGVPADLAEFPHMAAIGVPSGNDIQWYCGGSLISDRYILTAAHCMARITPEIIRLGDLDLTIDTEGAQPKDYGVELITIHPDYKTSSVYNDLALIRLKEIVRFNEFIRPACLGQDANDDNVFGLSAYGWGHTEFGGVESPDLQKITINMYKKADCSKYYQPNRRMASGVLDSQICAGDPAGLKDTCQGDSGGPLSISNYIDEEYIKMYTILGVTSFGQGCASEVPAIYTRVFSYLDWIENVVWNS